MDDEFAFAPDEEEVVIDRSETYKVLIVDDDSEVHTFTKLALKTFVYKNKTIEFISVYSEKEAREVLPLHDDIAVIFLDVVMETSTAGLNVASFIRNDLKDDQVRIIIRTGQSGEAPERYVIDNYDINDYKEKTELTMEKLYTTLRTALAQYNQIIEILNKKDEIYNLLITDKLTSLPNRTKLNYDLDSKTPQSLMLIDIDKYSLLNDAYGFEVADQVLLHLANILTEILNDEMTLYRLEIDVFAILIKHEDVKVLEDEVSKIKTLIDASPLELEEVSLYINVTIGIVHYQLGNIIQKAEIALRQAREISRNKIQFYDENKNYQLSMENNTSWTTKIASALDNDKILVYFQPIIDCKTDTIFRYETLVRLEHEGKVFLPIDFLQTARYSGYLYQITQRVFKLSCQKFQDNDLSFSVNISDQDLAEENFMDFINETSEKYNIKSSRIVFEIVEEVSMSGNVIARENLKKLVTQGYNLSIDDFGAACSNFSQLGKQEYESIKIDDAFIKDLDTNEDSKIITKSILFFTKQKGFKTVAEFVHSKEIYEIVKEMGVDYVQGYYLGEPKPDLLASEKISHV